MWRFIFLGLLIWLTLIVLKRILHQPHAPKTDEPDANKPNIHTEDMVQCARCDVHLPRSEAFLVNSKLYCCKDHIPTE